MATARLLFDDDESPRRPAPKSLVVQPQPGQKLNREQRKFNRLIARVEKLRERLGREQQRLEDALVFHAAEIRPRLARVAARRHDLVRALLPFLDGPGLKPRDRQEIERLLTEQIGDVLQTGEPLGDDLRALFERLNGTSLEQMEREELNDMRSELETTFSAMGLDLDLSGFRPGMSDEDLAAETARVTDEVRRQAEAADAGARARRTPRQEERERQAEALRKVSLGSAYRQLAKLLHPDLEQNPEARARKETLMQEVTAAYAQQDLHTLLRLQMEWLHREEGDLARLTDDTLRGYNRVLDEQVAELEFAAEALYMHPRYEPLMNDPGGFGVRILRDGPAQARELDGQLAQMDIAVARLHAPGALVEVKRVLQERRRARREAARRAW